MKYILFIILFFTASISPAQQQLLISKNGTNNKSFIIERGNLIALDHYRSPEEKHRLKKTYGKVATIEDSVITVRHIFSGEPTTVHVNDVLRIKREHLLPYLAGAITVTMASFIIINQELGNDSLILVAVPPAVFMILFEKVINPMKNIDKHLWKKKNKWTLTTQNK